MRNRFTKIDKLAGAAILISLVIRLAAIPFSMPIEADGVTRIYIAMRWLENPEFIYYGVWGPLYTYLIAAVLLVWNDPVYAPVVLNCIFAVATAIPLYFFVKREWSEMSGLFVACIYLAYPVAIRYGLVAMSEVPYLFFIALALLFLSLAREENGNWIYAALAGIAVTLAGSLRYEAWGLTPFLGLLLWKRWKALLSFFLASSIFPIFWMAGNYVHFGDPLYSLSYNSYWNLVVSAWNEEVTVVDLIFRVFFFPRALFFGLTPLAFLVCVIGMIFVIQKRDRQWVWLIPFVTLFLTFTINSITGQLAVQMRYSMGLAIFMLPFAAAWFEHSKSWRYRTLFSVITIASMIPFSYLRFVIPWPDDFPNLIPKQINAIPRLDDAPGINRISEYQLKQSELYPTGLLLDFFDWSNTFYVAIKSYKNPLNVFIMPGEVNEQLVPTDLHRFLDTNPTGILLLTPNSRFMTVEHTSTGDILHFTNQARTLVVKSLGDVEGIAFYSYTSP
jgi:4-amino-4-deoxy-L-arabinose transferase-like glycosyltransferase